MHSKNDSLRKERCSNGDGFVLSPSARRSCKCPARTDRDPFALLAFQVQ